MPHITVVSPVYGRDLQLDILCERLRASLSTITSEFEIILVDDQSPDDAWTVIQQLASRDDRIRGVKLSRNFGQHCAVTAGLEFVRGDWCVVMDCDLQDRPEEIPLLYNKAKEGYEIVVGVRAQRQDHVLIKLYSRIYYLVFNYLTEQKVSNSISNFGIYSFKAIRSIRRYPERGRAFGMLALLVGYKRAEIEIEHSERGSGKSSYTFNKRLHLALDQILSHSNKPLRLAVKSGFLLSAASFLYALWIVTSYFTLDQTVSGWTSLIVSLFFLSGITISIIGLVGLYVSKIYDEVKGRPLYIVESTTFAD